MGAQCCKQPEGVAIEESKFTTLGQKNEQEPVEQKLPNDAALNNNEYKAEYVVYANPIYQTVDEKGNLLSTGVDSNVYNQYFQTSQQEVANQQLNVQQNEQQVVTDQQVEQTNAVKETNKAEVNESQNNVDQTQQLKNANAQENLTASNNENLVYQPVQVINNILPVKYIGTTVAKESVLEPVTQPISYSNNVVANSQNATTENKTNLHISQNENAQKIQTAQNGQNVQDVQYANINVQNVQSVQDAKYVNTNVQNVQNIQSVQDVQYAPTNVQNVQTTQQTQYVTNNINQYNVNENLGYGGVAYNTENAQASGYSYQYAVPDSGVNYVGASSYAQPVTGSVQSYHYSTSYQLPTVTSQTKTTTNTNYVSYSATGVGY